MVLRYGYARVGYLWGRLTVKVRAAGDYKVQLLGQLQPTPPLPAGVRAVVAFKAFEARISVAPHEIVGSVAEGVWVSQSHPGTGAQADLQSLGHAELLERHIGHRAIAEKTSKGLVETGDCAYLDQSTGNIRPPHTAPAGRCDHRFHIDGNAELVEAPGNSAQSVDAGSPYIP